MKIIQRQWFWPLLILIATCLTYFPLFQNGFVNWDDDVYITQNPLIQSFKWTNISAWFSQPFLGLYQPFVLLSLALDYSINGPDPIIFHASNLLLHLINSLLVFWLIKNLFNSKQIAFVVAMLFGIHNMHVESVAWATERKNLLFVLFYLSSLNLYILFLAQKKISLLYAVFVLFIAALLSKASAVSLPLILILTDYLIKRQISFKENLQEKIPFFILSFIFGLLTLWFHQQFGSLNNTTGFSFPVRMLIAGKAFLYYLVKLLIPTNLTTFNPMPEELSSGILIQSIISFAAIIFIGWIIYIFFKHNKQVIWAVGFFVFNIGLFLIPPGVPVLASDRYIYPASIGFFILLALLINHFITKFPKSKSLLISFVCFYFVLISILTFRQVKTWENSFTLWNHVLDVHGKNSFALMQRGNAYKVEKDYELAITDYSDALKINPKFRRAYEQRGYIYSLQKNYSAAIYDFEKAVSLNPQSYIAWCSLGFIHRQTGEFEKSLQELNKALFINTVYFDARLNRGKTLLSLSKVDEACDDFRKALSLALWENDKQEVRKLIESFCPK